MGFDLLYTNLLSDYRGILPVKHANHSTPPADNNQPLPYRVSIKITYNTQHIFVRLFFVSWQNGCFIESMQPSLWVLCPCPNIVNLAKVNWTVESILFDRGN
ncbi:hypothetical protein BDA96_01G123100 [Sorghum bicolor]|uniref:Uncharacterized protein n=2 Tax=Sorghum bicolor TaxID=4558 RepID=A0A921UZV3_SORBI|nr:hypothetical protein BDA96_01G123100 [Sorghum bicolor]OQU91116.1 hypothetical protein SORBI_3001G118050 [Sorghum bicolor]